MKRGSAEFKAWQRQYNQDYRVANKEKLAEYERQRSQANKEKQAAYGKAWRAANREKLKEYDRSRYVERAQQESERSKRKKREDPAWYILLNAKARAKKKGIEFNLEAGDFDVPEKCPVLGIDLFWGDRVFAANNRNAPSHDRIDPSRGYIKGNVRVISNRANFLKNNATFDELRLIFEYVSRELGF